MKFEEIKDQQIQKVTLNNIGVIESFSVLAQDVNEVSGINGAGKTTLMASIMKAIEGGRSGKKEILNKDKERGSAVVETEDLIIEIEAKRNDEGEVKETITAKLKGHGKCSRKEISSLFKNKTIDPLEFFDMSSSERANEISKILGDEFNDALDKLNREKCYLYDNRRDAKRDLSKLGEIEVPEKCEEVTVSGAVKELNEAMAHNSAIADMETEYKNITNNYKDVKAEIDKRKQKIVDLQQEVSDLLNKNIEAEASLKEIVDQGKRFKKELAKTDRINLEPIQEKIDNSEKKNEEYRAYIKALEDKKNKEDKEGIYNDISAAYDRKCQEITDLVLTAKLPVKNLKLVDGNLYHNDIIWDDLNEATRIMISLKVATSQNNKFKILMVSKGNSLDSDTFKMLCSFAKKEGYQIWLESIIPHSEDALYLESGKLTDIPDLFKQMLKG